MGDRYARINHGYKGIETCSSLHVKPSACVAGSDDAQAAAAAWNVVARMLCLVCNPLAGSYSDREGRRSIVILCLAMACVPTVCLGLIITVNLHPVFYYASSCLLLAIELLGLSFAVMSDVMPVEFRTASYGLLSAGLFGGFSFAPTLVVILPSQTSVVATSLSLTLIGLLLSITWLPETREIREVTPEGENQNLTSSLFNPLQALSVLNETRVIRLIALASFLSSLVFAADATLLVYYLEEHLGVNAKQLATMFIVLAVSGIAVQGGMLQWLINRMGDHKVLLYSFICGAVHNGIYGAAQRQWPIYAAFILSQFTKLNTPILSSLASRHSSEHGRIQGALFALKALASALGPVVLQAVYHCTKTIFPGTLFLCASLLSAAGAFVVYMLAGDERQPPELLSEPLLVESEHGTEEVLASDEDPEENASSS